MEMTNCDFSSMKQKLIEGLKEVTNEILSNLEVLDKEENNCLLCELEDIKKKFITIEITASSFYLNCYLAAFTDKYSELASSLRRLSNHRHGALIVVERGDSVEPFIQKGVPVGAPVTSALMETIFYPGNPLHDGAVLIRGSQIVSASNVLPLTSTTITGKKVGTRHRAAMGLSERTDALVLVVSEETGKISFGLNGALYPIMTS